ncbi:hypothetical protein [Streptomyces lavendulocolor]|uniref:hypothetical protein n=1 Tax=Streptomyces lavendulocolor TaxID=67316 RepID=UPI003C2F94EF
MGVPPKKTGGARRAAAMARVAVVVRANAAPLWWAGLVAAGAGAWPAGLTGRRVGLWAGAALFLVTAAAVVLARRGRYTRLAEGAVRAARGDFLQDRAVTVRLRRRTHRWLLAGAFVAALASSFAVPGAGGLCLAGAGAGLWLKARWLGRRERDRETLYWVRVDRLAKGPAGGPVEAYRSTGVAAGDAAPGGARRR